MLILYRTLNRRISTPVNQSTSKQPPSDLCRTTRHFLSCNPTTAQTITYELKSRLHRNTAKASGTSILYPAGLGPGQIRAGCELHFKARCSSHSRPLQRPAFPTQGRQAHQTAKSPRLTSECDSGFEAKLEEPFMHFLYSATQWAPSSLSCSSV